MLGVFIGPTFKLGLRLFIARLIDAFMNNRETAKREKLKYDEQLDKLETELILTKSALQKELEYRKEIENSNHRLLIEQRELLTRLPDDFRVRFFCISVTKL
jgi:hypothetical protein